MLPSVVSNRLVSVACSSLTLHNDKRKSFSTTCIRSPQSNSPHNLCTFAHTYTRNSRENIKKHIYVCVHIYLFIIHITHVHTQHFFILTYKYLISVPFPNKTVSVQTIIFKHGFSFRILSILFSTHESHCNNKFFIINS